MTLHTPVYDVRTGAFCGPTAISAVTGLRISVIREALRQASGKLETANGSAHPVMGVANSDLVKAMELLGWRVTWAVRTDNKDAATPDKYRWDDFLEDHAAGGPFIVNVTGHYIAVSHGEVCDTFTKLPIPAARWKRGRKRWVKGWWKFERAIP